MNADHAEKFFRPRFLSGNMTRRTWSVPAAVRTRWNSSSARLSRRRTEKPDAAV